VFLPDQLHQLLYVNNHTSLTYVLSFALLMGCGVRVLNPPATPPLAKDADTSSLIAFCACLASLVGLRYYIGACF
jgi:hypothetical protein